MSLGPRARQLYAYWRTTRERVDGAISVLRQWHLAALRDVPGLRVTLGVRYEGDRATLLEVYAARDGIDDALLDRLTKDGDALTLPARDGPRRFEIFEILP